MGGVNSKTIYLYYRNGMPMKAVVKIGISNEAHHADPALGSSDLRLVAQSPLHYWAAKLDPDRKPKESTPAQKFGTALHAAILEPKRFGDRYIAMPEGLDRRTKEGKALWEGLIATGKEPLPAKDMERLMRMSEAIHWHPVSAVLWDQCKPHFETSLFWTDAETGIRCKFRPDLMIEPCKMFPYGLICDVKTAEDASPEGFARGVWNWEMHYQAAFYPDGFQAVFQTPKPPAFLWLAAEKESPFANAYYSAPESLMAYGRREYRRMLMLYKDCLERGQWPGYSTQVQDLVLPPWAAKVVEDGAGARE